MVLWELILPCVGLVQLGVAGVIGKSQTTGIISGHRGQRSEKSRG